MSEQTVQAPRPLQPDSAGPKLRRPRQEATRRLYRYRWLLGAGGLLLASTLVVVWARTRPGYDPYGWIVWGHLTIHFNLDTNGAPSWKPLPYLFTLPFALFGRYSPWLWMITSVAISLTSVVFAWRVAFRLVDATPERRYAAYAAGLVAAVAVLGINNYLHTALGAESDTMIVGLCLAAVDCILCRRYRWAFWLWWLAALGRPEAWAPTGLYAIWAWRTTPPMRRQMALGVVAIPLLWFGIPALSSKSPFSAASLAQGSPRALHGNKIAGTIGRFLGLNATPVKLAALLASALAALRRDRPILLLLGGVVLWVVVEVAFALHGWPAVGRYMYEPGAGVCVLAGVFAGRVILDAGVGLSWMHLRTSPLTAAWASVVVLAVLAVSLVPVARSRISVKRRDLAAQRARTHEINLLRGVVTRLGAARILACGKPVIPIAWQSILAWYLGTNTGVLYYHATAERRHPRPIVNLYPHSYGWQVFPSHTQNTAQAARCTGLTLRT